VTAFPSFAQFFAAVHGVEPFPWQVALSDRVAESGWPEHIDVPTGMGKTSVVDVAVHALARDLADPATPRRTHTRIAIVVDRRLIVDATHGHVATLVNALDDPGEPGVKAVADALATVGERPLVAERMRGGLTWSSRWARTPAQPMVVVGTVDQIGSRMLFRGYGTSSNMSPIDAGLLGHDTLVLLDEAHLSQAFAETVTTLSSYQRTASSCPIADRHNVVVQMSATPSGGSDSLLSAADHAHEVASRRLGATKDAQLLVAQGVTKPTKAAADMGCVLAKVAIDSVEEFAGAAPTILVVANTVDAARMAFDVVHEQGIASALVVGRCRPLDREVQLGDWMHRMRAGRLRSDATEPFVLVATQTIEVGVDLDADMLVTEVAPLDALIQRFGRVDRLGEVGHTSSVIVAAPGRLHDDPPPYGSASASTWGWLTGLVPEVGTVTARHGVDNAVGAVVDFGSTAIRSLLDDPSTPSDLTSPSALPPVVGRSAIECWRRTSPIPVPDENIVPYLHGVGRGQHRVSLLWRADLPVDVDEDAHLDPLPQRHELVEVSLAAARRFLTAAVVPDDADVEGAAHEDDPIERTASVSVRAFVRRSSRWVRLASPGELRPNDVVVVDTSAGGHDEWSFCEPGADGAAAAVVDVADLTSEGGPTSLRLDRRVLSGLLGRALDDDEVKSLGLATTPDKTLEGERGLSGKERLDQAYSLLDSLLSSLDEQAGRFRREVERLFAALATADPSDLQLVDHPAAEAGGRCSIRLRSSALRVGGDDGNDSSLGADDVLLDEHLASVGERARHYGELIGFTPELVGALGLAGRMHDLGKADSRFQAILRGGPMWLAESFGPGAGELLAKSSGVVRRSGERLGTDNPWPRGYRHEAISLALSEATDDEFFDGVDRALVEHLLASHHGRARPMFPAVTSTPHAAEVSLDGCTFTANVADSHPAWGQPSRFSDVCERYGEWGLALLEATLRLADISISEEGR